MCAMAITALSLPMVFPTQEFTWRNRVECSISTTNIIADDCFGYIAAGRLFGLLNIRKNRGHDGNQKRESTSE
jgi:hypothetical protein